MKKLQTKYASSPTLEGIKKQIAKFYGGEEKTLRQTEPGVFAVESASGKVLSTVVLETKRGFFFGIPDPEIKKDPWGPSGWLVPPESAPAPVICSPPYRSQMATQGSRGRI